MKIFLDVASTFTNELHLVQIKPVLYTLQLVGKLRLK